MATRIFLTLAQRIALADEVRKFYVESKMNDGEFAKWIQENQKFHCTARVVMDTREALKIPANFGKNSLKAATTVIARVEKLESEIAIIKAKLADLLK